MLDDNSDAAVPAAEAARANVTADAPRDVTDMMGRPRAPRRQAPIDMPDIVAPMALRSQLAVLEVEDVAPSRCRCRATAAR